MKRLAQDYMAEVSIQVSKLESLAPEDFPEITDWTASQKSSLLLVARHMWPWFLCLHSAQQGKWSAVTLWYR